MNKKLLINLCSLGPVGNLPAPGTWATIFTALFIVLFQRLDFNFSAYFVLTVIIAAFSFYVVKKGILYFQEPDPSQIVLDEVLGTLITFMGLNLDVFTALIGIILFRFFDIKKPFVIKKLEQLPGAYGVFLDDMLAAVISNVLLRVIILICLKH